MGDNHKHPCLRSLSSVNELAVCGRENRFRQHILPVKPVYLPDTYNIRIVYTFKRNSKFT